MYNNTYIKISASLGLVILSLVIGFSIGRATISTQCPDCVTSGSDDLLLLQQENTSLKKKLSDLQQGNCPKPTQESCPNQGLSECKTDLDNLRDQLQACKTAQRNSTNPPAAEMDLKAFGNQYYSAIASRIPENVVSFWENGKAPNNLYAIIPNTRNSKANNVDIEYISPDNTKATIVVDSIVDDISYSVRFHLKKLNTGWKVYKKENAKK